MAFRGLDYIDELALECKVAANADVLNSWKEIAIYVGRGVRTVQRWERELSLPVRRPRGKHRSAVIALREDIDAWLRSPHNPSDQDKASLRAAHQKNHDRLMNNAKLLITRTNLLLTHSDALQKQIARAIRIGRTLRISCQGGTWDRQNSTSPTKILHEEIDQAMELGTALTISESRRERTDPAAK